MKGVVRLLREARRELDQVTWPSRAQAFQLTLAVVAISLVAGVYLGTLDYLFQKLLEISL